VTVLRNGFDFGDLASRSNADVRREFGISPDMTVAACVGRLSEMKGQQTVVDALLAVPASVRDKLVVVFFGDVFPGNEKFAEDLKARVTAIGIERNVHLTGFRRDAREFLASCDFALVPSRFPDPLPTTVLEAMAAGLCVVGARTGGIPEMIVEGETGLLFEPGNAEALAREIVACVNDVERTQRLGHAARLRFEVLFSRERFQSEFVECVAGGLM
jgi:glycosyltransferase involved in cell wall biosynthesis